MILLFFWWFLRLLFVFVFSVIFFFGGVEVEDGIFFLEEFLIGWVLIIGLFFVGIVGVIMIVLWVGLEFVFGGFGFGNDFCFRGRVELVFGVFGRFCIICDFEVFSVGRLVCLDGNFWGGGGVLILCSCFVSILVV